jgi:glutamate-1-semialdehyde 2,1-aminomutase
MTAAVSLDRVAELKTREDAVFAATHERSQELRARARSSMPLGVPLSWMAFLWDHPPLFVAAGDGGTFTDVDGHRYIDMSLGITVASAGHTPEPVIRAVEQRIRHGTQFHLPTEDAIFLSEELARRWGVPKWQYALSSSQAVTDVIRLARIFTGRERVLVFEGKYQGHVGEILAVMDGTGSAPEYLGISERDIARTVVVDWNDLAAAERALTGGDVALVIAEPLLTNSGVVFPRDGFHDGLRRLTRETGTVLAIDETQSLPMAFGGLIREWGLEPDMVVLGKSLGGGVPVSAYGMSDDIAALIDREYAPYEVSGEAVDEPAVGGTMFANALSIAAARAAIEGVWTPETYERTSRLARSLADGMRETIRRHGQDWDVYCVGNRAGYRFSPDPPSNNAEAGERDIPAVRHLQRVYFLNRGVWEFGWWGGPAVSAQTTDEQIREYVGLFAEFFAELFGG